MDLVDADRLFAGSRLDLHAAVAADRQIQLGNLIVLRVIRVIENIYRLRSEGYSIKKAAVEGAGGVTGAIIASTLTTVCVFVPIVFTEGITRQLFVDIALTITFTLTASLIVALTFVPMMAAGLLKNPKEVRHAFFEKVQQGYAKLLELALRFKPVVFIGVTQTSPKILRQSPRRSRSYPPVSQSTPPCSAAESD